ncbi:hypothetical protein Leryth_005746 [Lithospermum erythrorhizon]|nr:hypothetical protein Leryth_005746 [Lithospermum erythrorhizon]
MKPSQFFFIFFCLSFLLQNTLSTDTLAPDQSLHDNQTLISNGEIFELGFFSLGKSKNKYLGIWYKTTPDVIVWVANRNTPLADSQGVLTLNKNGTLVLLNNSGGIIWSSENQIPATSSPVVKLLDTGNLVVQNDSDTHSGTYIWQSFDYPGNTRLPGMLMGENIENGQEIQVTSWKSVDDPSPGDFVYKIEQLGLSQLEIVGNGIKRFRSGPWNGICFNGLIMVGNQTFRGITDSANRAKVFYITDPYNASNVNRLVLSPTGYAERFVLNQKKNEWEHSFSLPNNPCDMYGQCGPNGICNLKQTPICRCLDRFVPKSEQEWKSQNWSSGCERSDSSSDCLHKGNDTFLRVSSTKLPDLLKFQMRNNMNLSECQAECLRNCSCTAYANPYVNSPDSACLMWYGDLLDVREFPEENEQSFYARVPLSETGNIGGSNKKGKGSGTIIIGVSAGLGIFSSLAMIFVCIAIKRRQKGIRRKKGDLELPLFQFSTIASATNNFSSANLIGEGGFGPVYKGQLSTGQEVAVKRLSKTSGQGNEEFRNEVTLIAKLQHRNLVRLLGCCIQGEEKMLIYEFMQNNSLDHFIFDHTRNTLLPWPKRFGSILGIARGLQYLHQDSRLKIIHRDLKTSNILLDTNLIPKISDFGLARILGLDQDFAKTKRVIGT